jgi:serpin B
VNKWIWMWMSWSILLVGESTRGVTLESLVQRNNQFALEFYKQLGDSSGNVILSPFSVSAVMTMAYAGAAGETARQMADVLHFTGWVPHAYFYEYLLHLKMIGKKGSVELQSAQALWAEKNYTFEPSFLETLRNLYLSELQSADFKADPEVSREKINAWVEQQTRSKIQNLLAPGVLDERTRLVLVNAVYFKGQWAQPFDPARTHETTFMVTPDEETGVMMMSRRGEYAYAENEEAQWLELPYAGNEVSMILVLPKANHSLSSLESNRLDNLLHEGLQHLRPTEVEVMIPRFKMVSTFQLNVALQKLGMVDAFNEQQADFSGMSSEGGLYISDVVQKAFVEVNEEGTEAAAATAATMRTTSMPAQPVVFQADHPFFFMIREKAMGGILFMGRVVDPSRLDTD